MIARQVQILHAWLTNDIELMTTPASCVHRFVGIK